MRFSISQKTFIFSYLQKISIHYFEGSPELLQSQEEIIQRHDIKRQILYKPL